jgi:hypothetical protein
MNKAWASVEAGKEFHWAHVLDASGTESCSLERSKTRQSRNRKAHRRSSLSGWLKGLSGQ